MSNGEVDGTKRCCFHSRAFSTNVQPSVVVVVATEADTLQSKFQMDAAVVEMRKCLELFSPFYSVCKELQRD